MKNKILKKIRKLAEEIKYSPTKTSLEASFVQDFALLDCLSVGFYFIFQFLCNFFEVLRVLSLASKQNSRKFMPYFFHAEVVIKIQSLHIKNRILKKIRIRIKNKIFVHKTLACVSRASRADSLRMTINSLCSLHSTRHA